MQKSNLRYQLDSTNLIMNKINERIYFPELDGLRFFAFFLVFLHHHSLLVNIPFLSTLNQIGWVGVDIFFVLSAFLFTKLLLIEYAKTETINFKKFYIRRIFRIWPIYFLFITLSFFVYVFIQDGNISNYIALRMVGLFTFSDNIITAIYGYVTIPFSTHLWTIAYEEQFYIFIPFIIFYLASSSAKTKIYFFVMIIILLNIIRLTFIYLQIQHPAIWVLPITHFESIVAGMIIGFGGFDFIKLKIRPIFYLLISLLMFYFLSLFSSVSDVTYWLVLLYSIVGLSTSMLLFALLHSTLLKKFFSYHVFVFLGKRSYGLYLYHLLAISAVNLVGDKFNLFLKDSVTSFFLSFLIVIILSIISYKVVETPFLKMKKRFEVIITRPI